MWILEIIATLSVEIFPIDFKTRKKKNRKHNKKNND